MSITELKGDNERNIADPDDIRKAIDTHIEEILHDSDSNPEDNIFITHLSQENTNNNMINSDNNPDIAKSNEKELNQNYGTS